MMNFNALLLKLSLLITELIDNSLQMANLSFVNVNSVTNKEPITVIMSDIFHTCMKENQVLYEPDGKCYPLLEQGPCERNEWLVANKEEYVNGKRLFRVVCRKKLCSSSLLYMDSDKKCHQKTYVENKLCSEIKPFFYDFYGEGHCECSRSSFLPQYAYLYYMKPCDDTEIVFVSSILEPIAMREDCIQNSEGECEKIVTLPEEDYDIYDY